MKGEQRITAHSALEAAIKLQQENVIIEKTLLHDQLISAAGVVMSGEFIKDKLKAVLTPAKLVNNLTGTVSGLVAGAIINKVVVGSSAGALRKVIGFVLQVVATKGIGTAVSALLKKKEKKM